MVRFTLDGGYSLRSLEEGDVTELHAVVAANREHLARWMPWATEQTAQQTLEFIRATRRQVDRNDGFQTAIVDDSDRIVGVIGFHGVSRRDLSAELGYWLAADTQGRGVMTAAASTLVDHAFSVLGLNRVEIRVAVGNARSRAIPERLGFKAEGTLREAERVGDRYHDVVVYAMLAHEWR